MSVGIAQMPQLVRDLTNRRIPGDAFEGPIRATAQRMRQTLRVRLVVIEPQGLLTGIPLRHRVVLIAANLRQSAVFDLGFNPAVEAAEDTRRRVPGFHRRSAHAAVSSGEGKAFWIEDATEQVDEIIAIILCTASESCLGCARIASPVSGLYLKFSTRVHGWNNG
jgi:hypothetical protein